METKPENRNYIILITMLHLLSIGCFIYPESWRLPLFLSAVFGPFISLRMGFDGGIIAAFVLALMMFPLMKKRTYPRLALFILSLGLWLFIGYNSGLWLYA